MSATLSANQSSRPVPVSVRAMLSNIIDYAGLFPPAKLDMSTTTSNYARYLSSADSWLVGRIIVPADRLDEFESCARSLMPAGEDETDDPWRVSATTAPADDEALKAQIERIMLFNEAHATGEGGLAVIDLIELRADSNAAIERGLDLLPDELYPFFELPVSSDPRGMIAALAGIDAGAKIRTGGVTAEMHPASAEVARFIAACAAADVPFKATAGLHQPLFHMNREVNAHQFGFLTLFLAAAFAQHRDEFHADRIIDLLEETDAAALRFDEQGVSWRDASLTVDEIDDSRLSFAVSFGSCSIDEPVKALQQLELL